VSTGRPRARDEGIGSWIRRRATSAPDALALVSAERRWTYGELDARIDRLAAVLQRRGVGAGDRVAYHGINHPLALESLFATATLGAVWVPLLPGRAPGEVQHILEDADARLVLRAGVDEPPSSRVTLTSAEVEEEMATGEADAPARPAVGLEDLAVLGYTSGTTGRPKGVMLSHANLCWNVFGVLSACGLRADDVTLAVAPLTRVGGLGVLILPTLFAGGTVVVSPGSDPGSLLAAIESHAVTALFANPSALAALAAERRWPATDLSRIRTAIVGGNLVAEPLLREYLDRGVPLRHGYGLTEAAPVVTLLAAAEARRKFGSVGTPIGLVDVAIANPGGDERGADASGEILVRGPNVTSGYWRRPDATAAATTEDGWWRTGDAGRLDAEGYLYVLDRVREGISIGSELVFPAQIESVLHGHPEVADVAAVGTPDGIVLFVVPRSRETFDAVPLWSWLRERLPPGRVPSNLLVVERIPRNAAAKIQRDALRARLGSADQGAGRRDGSPRG
jgi:fatty-acyl-CoA synthase